MQRYFIVGITAVAAMWMYIDRVCFSTLSVPIQTDLGISPEEKENLLGAFFFTYALFQIPMGTLADRFGARAVLAVSIAGWSLVTMATGFVSSYAALFAIRLMLGISESAAYPAAAGLVKRWAKPEERGRFSSAVALGGRLGGAAAPALTTFFAVALIGVGLSVWQHNPSGKAWRAVFALYGFCGLIVAGLFWLIVRDHPPANPRQAMGSAPRVAEQTPVVHTQGSPVPAPQRNMIRQIGVLARDRNMWLFGMLQFGVNIGWVLVITLLPTYLTEAFQVPLEQQGPMQSTVLIIGCVGMFFGGMITDAMRAWLGPKLGRSLPITIGLLGCAAAMFLVPHLSSAWAVVAALGVMTFLVDMHNPSIWSFAQDVGGRKVGAALGWGNMWGNLGAAISPRLLGGVARTQGWDVAFAVCGFAFVAAAVCGVLLDATKPVPD